MMALPAFSTAAVIETTSDASSEAAATPTGTQDAFERMRERSRKLTFEEQLGPENHANDTSAVDIQDLPFVTHHRRRYIRDSNVARIGDSNRKRQRRSWIGRWGVFLREIDKDYRALEDYWLCRLCDKRYSTQLYAVAATTSAIEHLRRAHGIDNRTRVEDWIDKRERGVADLFSSAAKQKGRRITMQNKITKIQETAVGVIVTSNVPFTFFCNSFVQSLMRTQTGGHIVDTVSWGPHAIREALQLVYSDRKKYIQSFLRFAETKIHITFDLWTSPNNKAYLSVCAHFLDASFSKKTLLLALQPHYDRHNGKAIAQSIRTVLDAYGITRDRLGVTVSDNASNNDTTVYHLYSSFAIDGAVSASDAMPYRLRCYGHILNLAAKAFLFGKDANAFESLLPDVDAQGREELLLTEWRKKGAIGKLHNLVK